MHETELARTLLAVVLQRAEPHGARRVLRVRGFIAETEALRPDVLRFHFQAHARGTVAEGAELELSLQRVHARCRGCGSRYAPEHHLTLCPECGSIEADVLGETGVGIHAIDVE